MQAVGGRPGLQGQQPAARPALCTQEDPGLCPQRTCAAGQAAAGVCSTLRHTPTVRHPAAAAPAARHDTPLAAIRSLVAVTGCLQSPASPKSSERGKILGHLLLHRAVNAQLLTCGENICPVR